ncbi:MAG: trypsin-like serine protease [Cyanobacteriota bacterium]|nr:trypsin-like serine protease [Cyanobacteriota bacterium]
MQTSSSSIQTRSRVSVSSNDPNDVAFIANSSQFTGVVQLNGALGNCTGALLAGDDRHILTAAHCFNNADESANLNPNPGEYSISFDLPTGRVTVPVEAIFVHPNWTAGEDNDNDIAIVKLAQPAPEAADRYEINTEFNEVGQVFTRVGYGVAGTGVAGEVTNETESVKRFGQNRYDALGDIFRNAPVGDLTIDPGLQLAFDFDSGSPANDAFGVEYGINDLGVEREIGTSGGDSGGPAFIDNRIAGVASYGFVSNADIDNADNTSFGEYLADTRVAAYADYIAQTLATSRSGDDTVLGTNRNDLLFGNAGNDRLDAMIGDDIAAAGRDNDIVTGGDGNDLLWGNRGNDSVEGGNGDDFLWGGKDDDTLVGGAGNDVVSGDLGNDLLTGGDGNDRFDFRAIDGVNAITDFTDGQDSIGLKEGLTFDQLAIAQVGNDTQITAAGGLSITLQGVNVGAIDATDFVTV